MAELIWLHLSDWHQRLDADFDEASERENRGIVRAALLDDIEARAKIDPSLAEIDFVVMSGDLAWSGKREELELAEAELLVPLMSTLELDPSRLRSEEHTSELQSRQYLVCRLLLEKKKT